MVVEPSIGQVMVKLPGGNHWLALEEGATLPVGSMVKAVMGTVVLTSAIEGGESQTGTFWGGIFQIGQAAGGNGLTDIELRGGSFAPCGRDQSRNRSRHAGPSALSSRRRGPVRRLWAKDDHGRFRTHGRDSVATTRGTLWLTEDRCTGTVTRVRRGRPRSTPPRPPQRDGQRRRALRGPPPDASLSLEALIALRVRALAWPAWWLSARGSRHIGAAPSTTSS